MIFIDFIATVAVYIIGSILLITRHLVRVCMDIHWLIGDAGLFLMVFTIVVFYLRYRNQKNFVEAELDIN